MSFSKTKIDKSGFALAKHIYRSSDEFVELEDIFDNYRKSHLGPLSETTLELQQWLANYGTSYYIAQRLKRKPQIIRKLVTVQAASTRSRSTGRRDGAD